MSGIKVFFYIIGALLLIFILNILGEFGIYGFSFFGNFSFLLLVAIFIMLLNLRSRIAALEKSILSPASPAPPKLGPKFTALSATSAPLGARAAVQPAAAPNPDNDWGLRFGEWLKEDWLLKLGALLLLIGFGWLTSYAFLHNWIGPMGRIALGILAGALILFFGWWRIRTFLHQGGVFLVLGSTVILLTIFAAREIYGFFTPLTALAVMFLSTAFVALASVKYNSLSLAVASLVLAGLAPLFTNAPKTDYVGLFAYLLVVILGAVWIVALTGWRQLTTAALLLVFFYSLPHFSSLTGADKGVLLSFAYAFSGVFFITHTLGLLKLKDKEMTPDLMTAAGNGLFLLIWIIIGAQPEWRSLIISAWMVVFAAGAFMVFRLTQKREPFYVYAGVGIGMLAAATAEELKGASLTLAYTIESGAVLLITHWLLKEIRIAQRVSLLLLGPVLLSFSSMVSRAWLTTVLHKDFFVLVVLMLTLFALAVFFRRQPENLDETEESEKLSGGFAIAGSFYFYALLWLSLHAALKNDDIAVMLALVVYTFIGLIIYFLGRQKASKLLEVYARILLGFVVARLFVVDIWTMALSGRIITFFLIGGLLITTAFFGRKKKADPAQTAPVTQ